MGIKLLLIVLAVTVFGGMFLGLLLSYRQIEAERARTALPPTIVVRAPAFYAWRDRDAALAEELALRQIEHHLRQEVLHAEQFLEAPSGRPLRAGGHSRMGAA